jgi:hypothetical protein
MNWRKKEQWHLNSGHFLKVDVADHRNCSMHTERRRTRIISESFWTNNFFINNLWIFHLQLHFLFSPPPVELCWHRRSKTWLCNRNVNHDFKKKINTFHNPKRGRLYLELRTSLLAKASICQNSEIVPKKHSAGGWSHTDPGYSPAIFSILGTRYMHFRHQLAILEAIDNVSTSDEIW